MGDLLPTQKIFIKKPEILGLEEKDPKEQSS